MFDELWNYGFPQEMRHFARCVGGKEEPLATGQEGAWCRKSSTPGYQSAGRGHA